MRSAVLGSFAGLCYRGSFFAQLTMYPFLIRLRIKQHPQGRYGQKEEPDAGCGEERRLTMMKTAMDTVWLIFMGVIDITILYRFVTEIGYQLAGLQTREDSIDRFAAVLMALGTVVAVMLLVIKLWG